MRSWSNPCLGSDGGEPCDSPHKRYAQQRASRTTDETGRNGTRESGGRQHPPGRTLRYAARCRRRRAGTDVFHAVQRRGGI